MYTTNHAKVWSNGNTNDKVVYDVGVKQGCPLSPPLFKLYIDELEIEMDETDKDSPCVFNIVIAILLYVDDVVLLSN